MDWFKSRNRAYQDGRLLRVSWEARGVFYHLLQLASERRGKPIEAGNGRGYTAAELARLIQWTDLDAPARMTAALRDLSDQHLVTGIEVTANNAVTIHPVTVTIYEEWQHRVPSDSPEQNAKRQATYRSRHGGAASKKKVTPLLVTSNAEERRGEEKKSTDTERELTTARGTRTQRIHPDHREAEARIAETYRKIGELRAAWPGLLKAWVAMCAAKNARGTVTPGREAGLVAGWGDVLDTRGFVFDGRRYEGVTEGMVE